jgi:phosphoglycerate kinase
VFLFLTPVGKSMKSLKDAQLQGKKVIVRVDFNVPLNKETLAITDDSRIREALPTLKFILDSGAALILMSHLGRPKSGPEDKYSLRHIVAHLSESLGKPVQFAPDCMGSETATLCKNLKPGEVLLLENLRFYPQEEKGEEVFARTLASYADIYVNDAFGTAHRAHASTAIMAAYFEEKYAGFLMQRELENADKVIRQAGKPFVAIMGGAKVSDKILIIEQLLDKVDALIIGGGMTYTFLKAQGKAIGSSLCEDDKTELALSLIHRAKEKGVQLLLPVDSIIADRFAADASTQQVSNDTIPDGWMGLDIGTQSILAAVKVIETAQTILWNGPMGVFELDPFSRGTLAVAHAVAEATKRGAFSLIGGGDSAAAVAKAGLSDAVSYVSTGGGALLEYMEGKELPGVKALG